MFSQQAQQDVAWCISGEGGVMEGLLVGEAKAVFGLLRGQRKKEYREQKCKTSAQSSSPHTSPQP